LLVGYFEGFDGERRIVWWAADSLALRRFLEVGVERAVAGSDSRTRG
jgi:hypothetical protein